MGWGKVEIPGTRDDTVPTVPPSAPAPDMLAYAGATSQRGVIIDRWSGGARVIVPPPRGWRLFLYWEWLAVAYLGGWFALGLSDGKLYYVVGAMAIAAFAWMTFTFWRSRAFLLNDEELCVGFTVGRGYIWIARWPRSAVGEVRMNSVNGKLLVRITGRDMREVSLKANREITREVAAALQQALCEPVADC